MADDRHDQKPDDRESDPYNAPPVLEEERMNDEGGWPTKGQIIEEEARMPEAPPPLLHDD